MILAAGCGERMRPLTDELPKPLLKIDAKPILQYHLEALAQAGIKQIVINHSWMGGLIEEYFGNGNEYGVEVAYSPEGESRLETGGGIKNALPLLGDDPFIVVNADVWTDYNFMQLPNAPEGLAHIVLVENPAHHPQGDFCLQAGLVMDNACERLTYSGIGVFSPELFSNCKETVFPLAPLLRAAIARQQIRGEHYTGAWMDIGTPERLQFLNQQT